MEFRSTETTGMGASAFVRGGGRGALDHRRRWQLIVAFGSLVAFLLLALGLLPDPAHPVFQGFDSWWNSWASGPIAGVPEIPIFLLVAFGNPPGVLVGVVVMLILAYLRRWWSILFVAAVYTVPNLVAQLVKHAVDRPRPSDPLFAVDHGSFPSGHLVTTAAFVILIGALCCGIRRRLWWPIGIAFAIIMAWSRTYVNAHWASDTLAGGLLGFALAILLWWLFLPLLNRDRIRHAERLVTRISRSSRWSEKYATSRVK